MFFFFKQKTAYEMRISDWSSDVCSSDLELNKMVLAAKPSIGFKYLFDVGLLQLIFPARANLYGVEVINGKGHKDNFYHTLEVLDNVAELSEDLWLRWAAIMHYIAQPAPTLFAKRHGWTFPGHEDKGPRMVPNP